jgi:hypothetical protein
MKTRLFGFWACVLALVIIAGASSITRPAPVAEAAHILSVADVTVERGKDFGSTVDQYWAHSKVYRRGDRFEVKVDLNLPGGWTLIKARMKVDIDGPPAFGSTYDSATCMLDYVSPMPPPPPAQGSCASDQNTVTFLRFEGIDPVIEVKWKRPDTTDVAAGKYRIRVQVTDAAVSQTPFDPIVIDCADDICRKDVPLLYVIFNPFQNSGDSHVTGLSNSTAAFYLGDRDFNYGGSGNIEVWFGPPNNLDRTDLGGKVGKTLRPANQAVFETVMGWIDPLGTKSAKAAIDEVTERASTYITGSWPPRGNFKSGSNVPDVVEEINQGKTVCGQCFSFGALLGAFTRSAGVPNRAVTTMPEWTGTNYFNFHVWNEVWLNEVTNNDWSAHDSTPGLVAKPTDRKSQVFKDRFKKKLPADPRAFTTRDDGARVEVTSAYNPKPSGVPDDGGIVVTPASTAVAFGETVEVSVVFPNPGTEDLAATIGFDFSLWLIDDLVLRSGNVAFSEVEGVVIPAGGQIERTYVIPVETYLLAGTFLADAFIETAAEQFRAGAFVHVGGPLEVRLEGPETFTPGEPVQILITVRNLSDDPLLDVEVVLHVASYMMPDADEFMLNLGAGEALTIPVTIRPPHDLNEELSVHAFAAAAGAAADSMELGVPRGPEPTPTPPPGPQLVKGDVNCSGEVDVVDALAILRDVAALSPLPRTEPCPDIGEAVPVPAGAGAGRVWGDMDCNGGVDVVDGLLILRHVAALQVTLPPGCLPIGSPA